MPLKHNLSFQSFIPKCWESKQSKTSWGIFFKMLNAKFTINCKHCRYFELTLVIIMSYIWYIQTNNDLPISGNFHYVATYSFKWFEKVRKIHSGTFINDVTQFREGSRHLLFGKFFEIQPSEPSSWLEISSYSHNFF